jgi:LuxR family maltose regulon positive regulatory protein
VTEARTVLGETDQLRVRRPDLGLLGPQADQLHAQLHTVGDLLGAASLTAAELRLLPLLSTHHPLDEIGEHLHLSRHTPSEVQHPNPLHQQQAAGNKAP